MMGCAAIQVTKVYYFPITTCPIIYILFLLCHIDLQILHLNLFQVKDDTLHTLSVTLKVVGHPQNKLVPAITCYNSSKQSFPYQPHFFLTYEVNKAKKIKK